MYDSWALFSVTAYSQACLKNIASNRDTWASYLNATTDFTMQPIPTEYSAEVTAGLLEMSMPRIEFVPTKERTAYPPRQLVPQHKNSSLSNSIAQRRSMRGASLLIPRGSKDFVTQGFTDLSEHSDAPKTTIAINGVPSV